MRLCWEKTIRGPWFRPVKALAVVLVATSAWAGTPLADLARAYRLKPNPTNRAAVLQFASTHKDTSGALAYLVLGSKEVEQKELTEALQHLQAAGKGLPALADYSAYLTAACHFEGGRYAEVERALKVVSEQIPASPLVEKSVVLAANAYLQEHQNQKAVRLVEQHRADLSVPEAEALLGHAYLAEGTRNPLPQSFRRS